MGGVKKYFKRQFKTDMLFLDHDDASEFYLSCFQENRSAIPLLCARAVIFLGCASILIASMVMTNTMFPNFGHWFIFLTHWGLLINTVAAMFACVVSAFACLKGPIDSSFGLPWYVKGYWVTFNMATPIAFFISLFYWSMLTNLEVEFSVDPVLDVFIHGVNSLLMLALLLVSRHPMRLLHFHCCLGLGILYLVFSVIYYFAGGLSPFGEVWIYPQLDWSNPGIAVVTTIGSAVFLIVIHALVTAIAVVRDVATKKNNRSLSISGAYN